MESYRHYCLKGTYTISTMAGNYKSINTTFGTDKLVNYFLETGISFKIFLDSIKQQYRRDIIIIQSRNNESHTFRPSDQGFTGKTSIIFSR